MIGPQPKDWKPLKARLKVDINPRASIVFENGFATIYSRGATIRITEWEWDEIAMEHAKTRIKQHTEEHRERKASQ
jgi:hypothetical protein